MYRGPIMTRHRGGLFVVATLLTIGCGAERATPQPATAPVLYGAGIFSTAAWDFFIAESPDGASALVCRADTGFNIYQIFETRHTADGRWSAPVLPAFAGSWSNADPHYTQDGRRLYFISNRPGPGASGPQGTYDIWTVSRDEAGAWGAPEPLLAPVNLPGVDEWSPSVAANGDLYFGAERPGGRGGVDLWVARRADSGYTVVENLGDSINTAGSEVEPWIAPDQSYIIFSALDRADSVGRYDLYLSRRVGGVWQRARRIDGGVSTPYRDFNQSVSPDGKWLYFSSTRPLSGAPGARVDSGGQADAVSGIGNGQGDIYRVPLSAIGIATLEGGSR
jgi:hypothetical protein